MLLIVVDDLPGGLVVVTLLLLALDDEHVVALQPVFVLLVVNCGAALFARLPDAVVAFAVLAREVLAHGHAADRVLERSALLRHALHLGPGVAAFDQIEQLTDGHRHCCTVMRKGDGQGGPVHGNGEVGKASPS